MSNESKKNWTPEPWLEPSEENTFAVSENGEPFGYLSRTDFMRARACVNFLADHPDLDKVEVVSKDELDRLRDIAATFGDVNDDLVEEALAKVTK